MEAKFVGFFPKDNDYNNPFENEGIIEICSVSECIRSGPKDWIKLWKHNDLGFYDNEEDVHDIIQKDFMKYTIFAYKLFLYCCEKGEIKMKSKMISRAKKLSITEDLAYYDLLGFDVVSSSESDFFECSALSCNAAYEDYKVNKYCLFEDLDYAMNAQKEISLGNYEPGEQYLLEVYKRTKSM